jgi:hypothetical protein
VSWAQERHELVERPPQVRDVNLDVRVGRGAEGEDDVVRPGRGVHVGAEGQASRRQYAEEQLLGPRLVEGHLSATHRVEDGGLPLDSDDLHAAVGEGERERQAHTP